MENIKTLIASNISMVTLLLHALILVVLMYGIYRAVQYLVVNRVLQRNIGDLYSNLKGLAEARGKSENELQRMYGNRSSLSFLDRVDNLLKYSGYAAKYTWLNTETLLVFISIVFAIIFILTLSLSNFIVAAICSGGFILVLLAVLSYKRKKNYDEVEAGLLIFINTIDAYSATTADLITLLEKSIDSLHGALRGYIIMTVDNARRLGNLSSALAICEDVVEHPFFKSLIRNLNISSRNIANYSEIIKGCRVRLQDELANTQKLRTIHRTARSYLLMLLVLGFSSVFIAAVFVANISVGEFLLLLQSSFIGTLILTYMIIVLMVVVYFSFIQQGKRR